MSPRQALRARLEAAIQRAIDALDALDGDADLEPGCDDEGFGQFDGNSDCVLNYASHHDQTQPGACY